jgi:hypothetical protein
MVRNHGEGCESLASLWEWCLLLCGLLVMWVVGFVNHYIIKFILLVAYLMLLLHHQSWTLLTEAVALQKRPWSLP